MTTLTKIIPALTKELSRSGRFNQLFFIFWLSLFAIYTKVTRRDISLTLTAQFNGQRFPLTVHSFSDIGVLKEIYLDREYDWPLPITPRLILDLGAHWGDTASYYAACYKEAKVIAVEPARESYARLSALAASNHRILSLKGAATSTDGTTIIHLTPSTLGNSTVNRAEATKTETVPAYTLETIRTKSGVTKFDLVKFDIEGAEYEVFSKSQPSDFADYYIGEVHEDLMGVSCEKFCQLFKDDFNIEVNQLPKKGRHSFKAWKKKVTSK